MKITVLGKYGPYPAPGGACSGYLVEEGDSKILLDCGSGVTSRMQQICRIQDLTAIVLSHLHSDHISDMMVLKYALDILTVRELREDKPLPVYTPQNPQDIFQGLFDNNTFEAYPIYNGMKAVINGITLGFREMSHPIESFGVVFFNGYKRLVYTGDTNYNSWIEDFARGADFFIADAGLLAKDKTSSDAPHLTAAEAGKIAANARVKKLMLTHIWPGYKESDILIEAAKYYPKAIMAREMTGYRID